MKTAETTQSAPSANPNNPGSSVSESPPMAIQDRIVAVMFLIVGFLFGIFLLVDLFSAFFR